MSRLAFFSPLPPLPTGIADYSADVLRILAPHHEIDAFHAQEDVDRSRLGGVGVFPFASFEERRAAKPYDAAVHQLGNSTAHAFIYEILPRARGLLVLHDLVLHHARAKTFLDSPEVAAYRADPGSAARREAARASIDRYRAEVSAAYPSRGALVADVHLDTTGRLLPYAYPLFEGPAQAATVVAAHNQAILDAVAREVPAVRVARLAMPMTAVAVSREQAAAIRARHGLTPADFVVGTLGLLTPEKEVPVIARAVARARRLGVRARLLLVGAAPDPRALQASLQLADIEEDAIIAGRVAFGDLPAYIETFDVAVHLRYPTARETSAALLRVLAQGRPTVMSDLDNFAEIPDDAVIRARTTDEEGEVTRAILRLVDSEHLRARLGRAAAAYVEREHSPARCLDDYNAAILAVMERGSGSPR